jgi:hypothetical protein
MSAEDLPPPASCLNNLHRVGDGREPRPDPTELCRNALGVFHMADCPLALSLPCAYYERAPEPHPTSSDVDLALAAEQMRRDFLGWRYRKRVRALMKPRHLAPSLIVLEPTPEPEEVVPAEIALRLQPSAEVKAIESPPTTEPVPAAPELYPGQRRSEERMARKRARLAAREAAAKAAQAAAAARAAAALTESQETGPVADEGDQEIEDAPIAMVTPLEDAGPVDAGPRTVEEVLASLPAPRVDERSSTGSQGPTGDRRRRRRRRGRRGGGAGARGGEDGERGRGGGSSQDARGGGVAR